MQRTLGRRIATLRKRKGLTQPQLAGRCDLWQGHIGKIERGEANVRLSTLVNLANRLDTTVERLLRGIW
jgi:transcriptional regulator with XRE-family HTH domain